MKCREGNKSWVYRFCVRGLNDYMEDLKIGETVTGESFHARTLDSVLYILGPSYFVSNAKSILKALASFSYTTIERAIEELVIGILPVFSGYLFSSHLTFSSCLTISWLAHRLYRKPEGS